VVGEDGVEGNEEHGEICDLRGRGRNYVSRR